MVGGCTVHATSFNHVSVVAKDLAESVRFYREMFGLEPVPTPNFGFPVQWLQLGSSQLHLFERPDGSPVYHHLGLNVDDFEAVYAQARERDIFDTTTFGHHFYELPNNVGQLYLRDPAGNLLEVNWPDVRSLDQSIVGDMKRLADRFQQSEGNLQSTLFVESGASAT